MIKKILVKVRTIISIVNVNAFWPQKCQQAPFLNFSLFLANPALPFSTFDIQLSIRGAESDWLID